MTKTRLWIFLMTPLLIAAPADAGTISGPVKPTPAPPAQQSAPAEKVAPPMRVKPLETTGKDSPNKLAPRKGNNTEHPPRGRGSIVPQHHPSNDSGGHK